MPSSQLIQVGIKFNADISLAKQLILSLQLTLQQIGNTQIGITGGSIESAVLSAKLLEVALLKAVNVNTGKLDFLKLNTSLKSMGTNVLEIGIKLVSLGPKGALAFSLLSGAIASAEIPARRMNTTLIKFGDTLLRTIRWQVASTMIHGFISTVRSAVGYIEDLDKSLNAIQIVTLKNDTEMANFAKTASKMAGLLSTVTKEYSNASLIFFQQGLDTAEVIERTNATIKLAKVTGDSVENISSKLTAIWNNFDDGTKSLEYYADVITKLGASTASSSDEIATGLQKFAAVADTVGLSYERATAALATVVALTRQSAEIVGTSFKTIFARVEGLKLGETLEDDVTLNQYSAALAKIGVDILDSNNNLKDMDTILDDLGNRWNKLSDALKVATAQTVAGVRQYSQFLALMDNYELVRANEDLAKDSKGTLNKQFKTYQLSIEALDKEIEKAKLNVFDSLFNGDGVKGFKEALIDIFGIIERIVKSFGGIKGIILTVGGLLLSNYLPKISEGIAHSVANFKDSWGITIRELEKSLSVLLTIVATLKQSVDLNNIETVQRGSSLEVRAAIEEKILEIRQKLVSQSNILTLTEKESLQVQILRLVNLENELVKLKEELEELDRLNKISENRLIKTLYFSEKENSKKQTASDIETYENNITKNNNMVNVLSNGDARTKEYNDTLLLGLEKLLHKINEIKQAELELQEKRKKASGEEQLEIQDTIKELQAKLDKLNDQKKLLDDKSIGRREKGEILSRFLNLDTEESQEYINTHLGPSNQEILNNWGNSTALYTDTTGYEAAKTVEIPPENADMIQAIEASLDRVKTSTQEIKNNTDETNSKVGVSINNVKTLYTTSGLLLATSKSVKTILKDIVTLEGKIAAAEKIKNTDSKLYEKLQKEIAQDKKNINVLASKLVKHIQGSANLSKILGNTLGKISNKPLIDSDNLEEAKQNMAELSNKSEEAQMATHNLAEGMAQDWANILTKPKEAAADIEKFGLDTELSAFKSEMLAQAIKEIVQALLGVQLLPNPFEKFMSGAQSFIGSISSISMGVTMIHAGVNTLSTAFAEGGTTIEKFTAIAMILRSTLMITKGVTDLLAKSKLFDTLATKLQEKAAARLAKAQAVENAGTKKSIALRLAEGVAKLFSAESGKGLIGVAIATAAAVGMVAMVSTIAGTSEKKLAVESKKAAEELRGLAESSKKAADSAKEEYDSVKDLYNEYEKLYKDYKDTGEEKLELYNKTKELVDKLDLENYKLELLAGNYDLVNKKIRELILLKTDNMAKTGEYSTSMASSRIFAEADAESGGLLVRGDRVAVGAYIKGYENTVKLILGSDYLTKYGVGKGVDPTINKFKLAKYAAINDLDSIYDSFTFSSDVLGAYQLDKFYKDLLTKGHDMGIDEKTLLALYQNYLNIDSSSREALDNAKTEFESQVNSLITQYVTNHEFTSIDDLNKIYSDLYNENGELNSDSEIFKSLAKSMGISNKSIEEQVEDITSILELADIDLEKLIVASYGNLGELYNLLKQINEQYKLTTKFNLDEILEAADITQQEFLDLFNSGKLNFNLIDWSGSKKPIQELVRELIKEAQKAADEKTVDFYYTLSLSAQKNWKSGMTYPDIIKFLEDHTDLFNNEETGEEGRLGITKEDFLSLSITEQKRKIEEASELSNLQKDYDNKILELENLQKELSNKDQLFLRIYNEGRKATDIDLEGVDLLGILNYIKADDKEKELALADLGYRGDWDIYGAARNGDKTAKLLLNEDFLDAIHSEYLSIEKEIENNNTALEATKNEKSWLDTLTPRLEFENDITFSDLNIDEVDELVENLPELVDSIEELDDELPKNKKAQEQVALAIKQTEKGLKSLIDNYEDWKEALKGKDELAKVTALKEMKDAFADIFDMTDELKRMNMQLGSYFSNYLLQNMDLVEKAADGDKDAILQLQRVAAEDILLLLNPDIEIGDNAWQSLLDNLDRMQELLDNNLLKIGEVDDTALKTSLTTMINNLGLSIDEASTLLAGMGFDAEVVEGTREIKKTWYRPAEYDEEEKGGMPFPVLRAEAKMEEVTGTETIPALKIKSLNYVGGGNISTKKGGTGRLSNKNSGGERSKKEPKKSSDEIERYHKLNKTLDSLSKQYSRISSAKDAAFGAQHLKYIEQENKLLQQQYSTEKALLKEIEQNYSKDRSAIEAYGAIIDQNGVITNYDQIMKLLLDKLNNAYAQYNAGGLSDEIIEAYEKEYEEFKKILSQFEETNSTYLDQLEKVEEAIRKQITNALEGIKAKVELELELPNQLLKMIEFKLKDLEDRAFSSSEKIALWSKLADIAAESFNHYADAFKDVLTMAVYDENGEKTGGFGLTSDLADRLMSGDISVLDEAGITGENALEIIDALKEYQDNLLEEYDKVREARKNVEEELFNQLNEYTEAIEQQISKLEKLNSIANNYKTLINTTGKELLGISAEIMDSINATILNTSKNLIAVLKAEQDALETNLEAARLKLANAMASGDEDAILYWKKVNEEIENSLLETKDTLLSTLNDYIEAATEMLKEKVQESFDDLAKTLYGMTFEDAQASYDRYKTLSDDYLKDYLKIYELSKLTRQVESSIDNTDNLKAKELLRDLQEEINEYQAEGVLMTLYEVDYLNKKYELRKAEIALEEAQNAKDQVRLSRNADGGWGYVYTANLQNIDKAQQTYEDKLYALQELNTKAIENTLTTILQLLTEYQNAINELFDLDLSEEERNSRINEITDYYTKLLNTLYHTLDSALNNNKELYEEDWNQYSTLTGYRISADQDYIDKFEETWLGKQLQGITSALESFELYKNTLGTFDDKESTLGKCYSAFTDYLNKIKEAFSTAGVPIETFANSVKTEMGKIKESSEEAKDEGTKLAGLLETTLPQTMDEVETVLTKTTGMFNAMKGAIEGVNTALTLLILHLKDYNNTDVQGKDFTPPDDGGKGDPYTAPVKESGDNGDNKNSSGGNNGTWTWWVPSGSNLMSKTTGEASTKELAISDAREAYESSFKANYKYYNNDSEAGYKKAFVASWTYMTTTLFDKYFKYIPPTFDTGGYTGAFGPEGRLAMLHEKELVLNKLDTSNMLKMIDIARQVIYDFNSSLPNFTAQTLSNALFDRSNGETNQNITIEAHFPNAVNHLEIEEAFRNLANYSAQNAYNLDLSQNINIF